MGLGLQCLLRLFLGFLPLGFLALESLCFGLALPYPQVNPRLVLLNTKHQRYVKRTCSGPQPVYFPASPAFYCQKQFLSLTTVYFTRKYLVYTHHLLSSSVQQVLILSRLEWPQFLFTKDFFQMILVSLLYTVANIRGT